MLRTVMRVQGTLLKRDRALWWVAGAFLTLLVYTGVSGAGHLSARQAQLDQARQADAARLEVLSDRLTRTTPSKAPPSRAEARDPYAVGDALGRRAAVLDPGPLAVLTQADDSARPRVYEVTLDSQLRDPAQASRAVSLGRVALGALDMSFVLIYLLPLLIIALTYDLLLGERELGTLAMIFAQPVAPRVFLIGKLLARALVVAAVALVPALVVWLATAPLDGAGVLAVALGALVLVSYAAFWMSAALATNAWLRSSAASALALMGLWLVSLILVPGLIRMGVETLHPPPSRVALVNLKRQTAQEAERDLTDLEGNHGAAPEGAKDPADVARRKVKAHQHMDAALEGVLGEFEQQLARQQALVRWLQLLSPAVVAREALAELAGDSVHRHQRFKAQAIQFHTDWKQRFYAQVNQGAPFTADQLAALPAFTYTPEDAHHRAERVIAPLFGLWLPTAGLIVLALVRVRRIGRL